MPKEKIRTGEKRPLNKASFLKLHSIFKYLLPYKTKFVLGLLLLVMSSFLLLAFPLLSGKLIDVASGARSWVIHDVNLIALSLGALLLLQGVLSFFRVYLFAQVSEHAMADVRYDLYQKMIHLPMAFFDRYRTGDLMSRISSDVSLLQNTFSTTLAEIIRQLVTLIAGIAMIFIHTPSLSIFMLATLPVLMVSAMVFGKRIRRLSRHAQDQLADASTVVEETLQSIFAVKSFTNEALEKHRYKTTLERVVSTALRAAIFRAGFISFIIFALFGGMVAILWYGAVLLQRGDLSMGDLVSFAFYTAFIGGSIAGIGDLFGQVQRAIGASERIIEIHQASPETLHAPQAAQRVKLQGDICFRNVSFVYSGREKLRVLKDLSFAIQSGEKIALVGKSGSGKSTIAHLLMRLYDGFSGEITLDQQSIDAFDLTAYRENIGIVPQEIILFGGTIRENIAYGKPQACLAEVKTAARQAHALEFIESFPEGFETLVGERGVKLSGGQRQRIAIARTLLKNPALLILDEATSSLDADSEQQVQMALDTLMEDRTTLIIAHRLATIKRVDRIYVLEEGRIMESGTHEELMNQPDSRYHHLVKLQLVG